MRLAIIDLGTNTCNLLIAEILESNYKVLYRGKEPVRLLFSKKNENWIREDAFIRTSQALENHLKKIREFSISRVELIATSAVRDAGNRDEFVSFIQDKTGLEPNVITGEREAELIFKGALLAFNQIESPSLILDIGGGSNEFIVTSGSEIIWEESIPSGMSRIINMFSLSDPISKQEETELIRFFKLQHIDAIFNAKNAGVRTLIGCSGAFDTIADLIDKVDPGSKKRVRQEIRLNDFFKIYKILINSTRKERKEMKGMDNVRIDLIVPAVILINQVITALDINTVFQTDYALREGVMAEII
ncbi:MAG: hypothetical protein JXR31_15020 [Prolixibacteraceae bacterium]|nr:hypothetical protein [Prolixibacteraceae bacterium]MBN2775565.1 hypothetical protein [Prolixibacteraceae bacterium]